MLCATNMLEIYLQAAFTLAYSKSSPTAQKRYSSRGRPIKFSDDVVITSGLKWNFATLHLTYNMTGLFVTATKHHQNVSSISKNTGHDDCTLLSPFRAMEWIYIDSLKYTKPYF